jgi:DNA-binding CsgD family transcriptional regulator
LLIVGAYREAELDAGQPFEGVLRDLQREGLARRMTLRRLEPSETRLLVSSLLETPPEQLSWPVVEAIQRESAGVPFFIHELLLHLREEELLTRSAGVWQLAVGAEASAPQSVRSVIGHRLERVAPETHEALTVGAVIGSDFSFELLRAVLLARGWHDDDQVVQAIEEACARQLLVERTVVGPAGDAHFAFAHQQIQGVLYRGLNAIRRRALHQLIAETIETFAPEPQRAAARLAYHYSLGEDLEQAAVYTLQAASAAARLHASEEAVRQYDTALDILDVLADRRGLDAADQARRFSALLERDSLLDAGSERVRQLRSAAELLAFAEQYGDDVRRYEARLRSARAAMRAGELAQAQAHARLAREFASELDGCAQLRAELALVEAHLGRVTGEPSTLKRPLEDLIAAARHLTAARELAEQLEQPAETAWLTQELGVVLWALSDEGDHDGRARARAFLVDALERFRVTGDRKGEITALIALAYRRPTAATDVGGPLHGSYVAFLEEIRRLRKSEHLLARVADRPRMEALSLLSIHINARTNGWYDTALERGRQALEWAESARDQRIIVQARLGLAETERLIGRPAAAVEHANHALALIDRERAVGPSRRGQREQALGALAAAQSDLGHHRRALELAAERFGLAQELGGPLLADATIARAEALLRAGALSEAADLASSAVRLSAGLPGELTWDLRAFVVLARIALQQASLHTALDYASTAVARAATRDPLPIDLALEVYLVHALAHEAAGSVEAARLSAIQAVQVAERIAGRILDPESQAVFLAHNSAAVATLALAHRLGMATPSATPAQSDEPRAAGLTARETEVLGLVAAGRTNREISQQLYISEKTVARHLTNIFNKIDAQSRTQAAAWAFRNGLA